MTTKRPRKPTTGEKIARRYEVRIRSYYSTEMQGQRATADLRRAIDAAIRRAVRAAVKATNKEQT